MMIWLTLLLYELRILFDGLKTITITEHNEQEHIVYRIQEIHKFKLKMKRFIFD